MTDWVDPFDLPEWLGETEVTWAAVEHLRTGHLVRGALTGAAGQRLDCDLFAVDEAFPEPVADDDTRRDAHRAWRHGQVLLASCDDRVRIVVPGTGFDADRVLEVVTRLAKALGAPPDAFAVHLRLH